MIFSESQAESICSAFLSSLDENRARMLEVISSDLVHGDLPHSLTKLEAETRRNPDQVAAWEFRGLVESRLGQHNSAISSLETAALLAPLHPLASRCLALEYFSIGKRMLATELLSALGSTSDDESFIRLLNHDLIKRGATQAAVEMLFEALNRIGESAALWHELSASLSQLPNHVLDSLSAVGRAIQLEPGTACYRVSAAVLLIRLDQPEQAFDVVSELSERSIRQLNCPCCLWRLLNLYYWFNDDERASVCQQQLESTISLQPRNGVGT